MVGHAVSNVVPVVAANRVGTEHGQTFYGTSFITDERGDILAELDREEEGVIVATLDLDRSSATAPRSASSATAGPSCTGGWSRISESIATISRQGREARAESLPLAPRLRCGLGLPTSSTEQERGQATDRGQACGGDGPADQ